MNNFADPFAAVLNFPTQDAALRAADEMEKEWYGTQDRDELLEQLAIELKYPNDARQ